MLTISAIFNIGACLLALSQPLAKILHPFLSQLFEGWLLCSHLVRPSQTEFNSRGRGKVRPTTSKIFPRPYKTRTNDRTKTRTQNSRSPIFPGASSGHAPFYLPASNQSLCVHTPLFIYTSTQNRKLFNSFFGGSLAYCLFFLQEQRPYLPGFFILAQCLTYWAWNITGVQQYVLIYFSLFKLYVYVCVMIYLCIYSLYSLMYI